MIAEEDLRGITARSTKNGTRPLRIVTTTREMDSCIHMVVHVMHIFSMMKHFVTTQMTSTLPLLKCVVLAGAEIREFARTQTTEPRTAKEHLV